MLSSRFNCPKCHFFIEVAFFGKIWFREWVAQVKVEERWSIFHFPKTIPPSSTKKIIGRFRSMALQKRPCLFLFVDTTAVAIFSFFSWEMLIIVEISRIIWYNKFTVSEERTTDFFLLIERKKREPSQTLSIYLIEFSTFLELGFYLKYLSNRPFRAFPCLASSLAISCTVRLRRWGEMLEFQC